jgi:heme oxygenase
MYEELERGLDRHGVSQIFAGVRWADLYRTSAMERDLLALAGSDWKCSVTLLAAGRGYANQVVQAATGNGERLIAHAYTRYLGDLSGGQILKRLLGRSLGLGPETLSFYEFPAVADLAGCKSDFRTAIDAAATSVVDIQAVVEEAATAFRFNIELSQAIQSVSKPG